MTDSMLNRTLGPFAIVSELGRGGMAVVYKAFQNDLQRTVALKILPPELSLDTNYVQRFLQEARSAAALEHPHIVPIYAIGASDGFNYIAMKYIAGQTLKDIVQQRGALPLGEAAAVLEQVAGALDYAHSRGVIHRDIKPSNMMTDASGWMYLTDFGLARGATSGLTLAGTVMGTPEYMSPEQAQGLATIGPPTDIYALGVVLYELLTGYMPFNADTPMGMLVARLQFSPRPPRDYRSDLPEPVEDVIMRALARRPEMRFGSARDMIAALKRAAGLGTAPLTSLQQPISPPQGTPAAAPTLAATPLPQRAAADGPTTLLPALNTQSYADPSNASAATAPRMATPLPMPTAVPASDATLPAQPAPTPAKPRSRRGIGIVIGAIALVLVAAFLINTLVLNRVDPRIEQGMTDGRAALTQLGGMDRAIAAFKQVLALDPNNADAHAQLALIYGLRHHNADAIEQARAAIKADPQDAFARAVLADALTSSGEDDEARTAADEAIKLNDKLSFGYNVRAAIKADEALEDFNEDLMAEAGADADKALQLAQSEDNLLKALAHSARGYVYWQEYSLAKDDANVDRGIQEFNQAIGLAPQIALFHSNLGYFYDAQNKHEQAQQAFEAALAADSQYGHAHSGLGWNLAYTEDYEGAIGEFEKGLAADPIDSDAHIGLASAYQNLDPPNYDQAIATLEEATKATPKNPAVFASLGWAHRAHAFSLEYGSDEQRVAYDAAAEQFQAALNINDRYVDALNGLGAVLLNRGETFGDSADYNSSIATLEKSLEINDQQAFANEALGWSQYGAQDYAAAESAFQNAIDLQETYPDAYYGLGRALQGLGRTEEARTAYQTAVDQGSDSAKDALAELK